jgi:mono/diheme cytochrome c family protein
VRGSVALLGLVTLLAAGCGGGGATVSTASLGGNHGRLLFVSECGACHTLADAGTKGIVGKNLDRLQPSRAAVLRAIAQGPGNMPAGLVTGADARAIATYVFRVAGS